MFCAGHDTATGRGRKLCTLRVHFCILCILISIPSGPLTRRRRSRKYRAVKWSCTTRAVDIFFFFLFHNRVAYNIMLLVRARLR